MIHPTDITLLIQNTIIKAFGMKWNNISINFNIILKIQMHEKQTNLAVISSEIQLTKMHVQLWMIYKKCKELLVKI